MTVWLLWSDWGRGRTLLGVFGSARAAGKARRALLSTPADEKAYRITKRQVVFE